MRKKVVFLKKNSKGLKNNHSKVPKTYFFDQSGGSSVSSVSPRINNPIFSLVWHLQKMWVGKQYAGALLNLFMLLLLGTAAALQQRKPLQNEAADALQDKDAISDLPPDAILLPQYFGTTENYLHLWRGNTELFKAISDASVAYDPSDAKSFGMTEQQYEIFMKPLRERVRLNLIHAAPPDILKRVLQSRGFAIVVRPLLPVYSKNFYKAETGRHLIVIAVGDESQQSDAMLKQVLRNEFFHATSCLKPDGSIITEEENCLTKSEINALKKAIASGHNKIAVLKKDFEAIKEQWNKLATLKLSKDMKTFLSELRYYEPIHLIDYQSPAAYKRLLEDTRHKILPDGRLFVRAGDYYLNKMPVPDNLYITFNTKHQQTYGAIQLTYSFAQDDSLLSKAHAFFADFAVRNWQYDHEGSYKNLSEEMKTYNRASDVAQLPSGLKTLFYPEFCALCDTAFRVKNYCVIPEGKLVPAATGGFFIRPRI